MKGSGRNKVAWVTTIVGERVNGSFYSDLLKIKVEALDETQRHGKTTRRYGHSGQDQSTQVLDLPRYSRS
jgi:hypothetical protein